MKECNNTTMQCLGKGIEKEALIRMKLEVFFNAYITTFGIGEFSQEYIKEIAAHYELDSTLELLKTSK